MKTKGRIGTKRDALFLGIKGHRFKINYLARFVEEADPLFPAPLADPFFEIGLSDHAIVIIKRNMRRWKTVLAMEYESPTTKLRLRFEGIITQARRRRVQLRIVGPVRMVEDEKCA